MSLKNFFGCCGQWIAVDSEGRWKNSLGDYYRDQIGDYTPWTGVVRQREKSTDLRDTWGKIKRTIDGLDTE